MRFAILIFVLFNVSIFKANDSIYVKFNSDTVKIFDETLLNCCSSYKIEASVHNFEITLTQIDTGQACKCLCRFILTENIYGLAPGKYKVSVFRSYSSQFPDSLFFIGSVDFNFTGNDINSHLVISSALSECLSTTDIIGERITDDFCLSGNYPNPFNPVTKIKYSIKSNVKGERSKVLLIIYDVLGNEISTLVNEQKIAGDYEVEFDGTNLSSGVYYYCLSAGRLFKAGKMILIK